MIDGVALLTPLASGWASALWRASWQGGVAVLIAAAICRLVPRLSPRLRCWLWRLVYLKLFLTLFWIVPLNLPLLPAPARIVEIATESAEPRPLHPSPPNLPQANTVTVSKPQSPLLVSLLCLWLVGCGGRLWRLARDQRHVRRLRLQGQPADNPALLQECESLCRTLGIPRCPELRMLPGDGGPLLVGALRPAILLPESLWSTCTSVQHRLILAHELAHQKRRDLLWAWVPALARCIFFFHPLVWYCEREWELSQELACDELALRLADASRSEYGDVLLKVTLQPSALSPTGFAALCVAESYTSVRKRLLAMKEKRVMSRAYLLTTGATLGVLGLVGIVPWRVSAQEPVVQSAVIPDAVRDDWHTSPITEDILFSGEAVRLLGISVMQQKQLAEIRELTMRQVYELLGKEQHQLLDQQTEILRYDRIYRAALDKVSLTEVQKDRIYAIREEFAKQFSRLKSDPSLTVTERVSQAAIITKQSVAKCQSLLAPEQQAQLDDLMSGGWNLTELNLSENQKAAIAEIRAQQDRELTTVKQEAQEPPVVKQDAVLPDPNRELRFRVTNDKFDQEVRQILTPEQRARLTLLQRQRQEWSEAGNPFSLPSLELLGIATDTQISQVRVLYKEAYHQAELVLTPGQKQKLQRLLSVDAR